MLIQYHGGFLFFITIIILETQHFVISLVLHKGFPLIPGSACIHDKIYGIIRETTDLAVASLIVASSLALASVRLSTWNYL